MTDAPLDRGAAAITLRTVSARTTTRRNPMRRMGFRRALVAAQFQEVAHFGRPSGVR